MPASQLPIKPISSELQASLDRCERLYPALVESWWARLCQQRRQELQQCGRLVPFPLTIDWSKDPLERFGEREPLAWKETFELLHARRGNRFLWEMHTLKLEWSYRVAPDWVDYDDPDEELLDRQQPPWAASSGIDVRTQGEVMRRAAHDFPPEIIRRVPLLRPWADSTWREAQELQYLDPDVLSTSTLKPLVQGRRALLRLREEARAQLRQIEALERCLGSGGTGEKSLDEGLRRRLSKLKEQEPALRKLVETPERDLVARLKRDEAVAQWILGIQPTPAVRTALGDWKRLVPDKLLFGMVRSLVETDTDWLFAVRSGLQHLNRTDVTADTWRTLRSVAEHGILRSRSRRLAQLEEPWRAELVEVTSEECFQIAAHVGEALALAFYYQGSLPARWAGLLGPEVARELLGRPPDPIDVKALKNRYHRKGGRAATAPTHPYQPRPWIVGFRPPGAFSPVR